MQGLLPVLLILTISYIVECQGEPCLPIQGVTASQRFPLGNQLAGDKPLLVDGDPTTKYSYSLDGSNFCQDEDAV